MQISYSDKIRFITAHGGEYLHCKSIAEPEIPRFLEISLAHYNDMSFSSISSAKNYLIQFDQKKGTLSVRLGWLKSSYDYWLTNGYTQYFKTTIWLVPATESYDTHIIVGMDYQIHPGYAERQESASSKELIWFRFDRLKGFKKVYDTDPMIRTALEDYVTERYLSGDEDNGG